jgi:hypothetical protein
MQNHENFMPNICGCLIGSCNIAQLVHNVNSMHVVWILYHNQQWKESYFPPTLFKFSFF